MDPLMASEYGPAAAAVGVPPVHRGVSADDADDEVPADDVDVAALAP